MKILPAILQILQKCWQNQTLDDSEEIQLRSWLSESEENRILFDNIETRFPLLAGANIQSGSILEIPIPLTIPESDDLDNGSANAFEATENPIGYEDEVSDEQLDDRMETE